MRLLILFILAACATRPPENQSETDRVSLDSAINHIRQSYILGCVEALRARGEKNVYMLCRDRGIKHAAAVSRVVKGTPVEDSGKPLFGFEPLYTEGSPLSHFASDTEFVSIFPAGIYGNETSGFSYGAQLPPGSLKTISYEVFFSQDFDFVKGGKLPGLCGGLHANGGNRATGTNGFSARIMWREKGRIVSYVYHVDQKDRYGDNFQWISDDQSPLHFRPDQWHKIKMTVRLNEVGKSNGLIRGYLDGKLAFEKSDFNFRTIPDISIDRLCFNTFFGGDDQSWAPKTQQELRIRNLTVEDDKE